MRKFALLITAAAILLSSCTQPKDEATTPQVTTPSSPSPKAEETSGPQDAYDIMDTSGFNLPQTLIDDDYISVVLQSVEPVNSLNIDMVFAIQNKTESTYSFDMKSFSLNNLMMPEYNSQFEITSGENGTYTQKIKFDTLSSVYGIKKVVSIKFDYTIAGSENSGLITMGSVSVSNGKEQAAQEIDDLKTDYLIASDEYADVYFADAYYGEYDTECYELLIYNKTDESISITSAAVAINGVSVTPWLGMSISPKSYMLFKDSIPSSETSFLTGYNKAASVQLEFTLLGTLSAQPIDKIAGSIEIDDSIQVDAEEFEGQILYDENALTLGVQDASEDETNQKIIFYAQNHGEVTAFLTIEDVTVNGTSTGQAIYITVLPGTYAFQYVSLGDTSGDAGCSIKMGYTLISGLQGEVQTGNFEFALGE